MSSYEPKRPEDVSIVPSRPNGGTILDDIIAEADAMKRGEATMMRRHPVAMTRPRAVHRPTKAGRHGPAFRR